MVKKEKVRHMRSCYLDDALLARVVELQNRTLKKSGKMVSFSEVTRVALIHYLDECRVK